MIEILLKEWIEQVKYYIHLIADYSIKESQVGAVLDDVLNLSGKMFRSKLLLLCAFLGSNWKNNKEKICKLFYELGGMSEEGDGKPIKVTYHDSCHLKRSLKVSKEQRELLKHTKGVEFIEMNDCDNCCGFGGSYSLLYPEISAPILEKKIQNIKESGADVVALDCPGCLMQIKGGLDARGINDIKVKHTAEIIAEKRGLI